jgi:molecular chaperone DnaJ
VKVPAGVQHGTVLRLHEKGMPRLRGRGRGDLLVRIKIDVPKQLTDKQRELLHELAKTMGQEIEEDSGLFKKIFGT